MSDFDDDMAAADAEIFSGLGGAVIYTPIGSGVPRQVQATVDFDVKQFPGGFETQATEGQTEMEFLVAQVPDPAKGDLVQHKGVTYEVRRELSNDGFVVRVVVNDA